MLKGSLRQNLKNFPVLFHVGGKMEWDLKYILIKRNVWAFYNFIFLLLFHFFVLIFACNIRKH